MNYLINNWRVKEREKGVRSGLINKGNEKEKARRLDQFPS